MKKLLVILLLFIGHSAARGQSGLPDSALYYGMHWGPGIGFSFIGYSIDSVALDSVVGPASYYSIFREYYEIGYNRTVKDRFYLKFDSSKLYYTGVIRGADWPFRDSIISELIFDFNKKPGDTLAIFLLSTDSNTNNKMVIDSVGYRYYADGKQRRTIYYHWIKKRFAYEGTLFAAEGLGFNVGLVYFVRHPYYISEEPWDLVSICSGNSEMYAYPKKPFFDPRWYTEYNWNFCGRAHQFHDSFLYYATLGIQSVSDHEIRIYPNPSNAYFELSSKIHQRFEYALYSPQGQLLKSGYIENGDRIGEELRSGMYLIQLYQNREKAGLFKLLKI